MARASGPPMLGAVIVPLILILVLGVYVLRTTQRPAAQVAPAVQRAEPVRAPSRPTVADVAGDDAPAPAPSPTVELRPVDPATEELSAAEWAEREAALQATEEAWLEELREPDADAPEPGDR